MPARAPVFQLHSQGDGLGWVLLPLTLWLLFLAVAWQTSHAVVVLIVALLSAAALMRQQWRQRWRTLLLHPKGVIEVIDHQQRRWQWQCQGHFTLGPVVGIYGHRRLFVLYADQLAMADFRRLRLWLRWSKPAGQKAQGSAE